MEAPLGIWKTTTECLHQKCISLSPYTGVKSNLKVVDGLGQTALHYAAQFGPARLVRNLLRKGANRDVRDQNGMTPADLATDDDISTMLYN